MDKIWLLAVIAGVVMILLAIMQDGLGPLDTTQGVIVGVIVIIAALLVQRIGARKTRRRTSPRV